MDLHAALYQILVVGQLFDQLFFIRIILVADLTHQLFDHVFHGDHTYRSAVLTQHKSDAQRFLADFHQQVRYALIFICIIGFPQYFLDLEFLCIFYKNKILDIDHAHDMIRVTVIDRDPGKHGCLESGKQFLVGGVYGHGGHLNAGDHDILGDRIAEIKYVIDQLPLLGLDHAALVAYVHIGFKFFLCNAEIVAVGADVQQPQDPVGDPVDHEDDGGQDAHQHTDDAAVEQGDPLGVLHGPGLGDDLTKHQDGQGKCAGHKADGVTAPGSDRKCGSDRRCGQVDDIIADQNGAEHFAILIQYAQNSDCSFVVFAG